MLYFHNTSQKIQKFATYYATKRFQLVGNYLTRASAPGTRWGHSPQIPTSPQCLLFSPNLGCLSQSPPCQVKAFKRFFTVLINILMKNLTLNTWPITAPGSKCKNVLIRYAITWLHLLPNTPIRSHDYVTMFYKRRTEHSFCRPCTEHTQTIPASRHISPDYNQLGTIWLQVQISK